MHLFLSVPSGVETIQFPHVIDLVEIEITWIPPNSICPATEYHVNVIATSIDHCENSNKTVLTTISSDPSVVLRNLSANSAFSIIITSANEAGMGEALEVAFATQQAGK